MRYSKNYNSLPYNKNISHRASALRKARILSEALLWNRLKDGRFLGLDFDRQKQIGNYFADFYCAELGLVIEIDGISHENKYEYDKHRDEYMKGLGLHILRLSDEYVRHRMEMELDYIERFIGEIKKSN
jgi:very-short-patch-repair endonuclease